MCLVIGLLSIYHPSNLYGLHTKSISSKVKRPNLAQTEKTTGGYVRIPYIQISRYSTDRVSKGVESHESILLTNHENIRVHKII